MLLMRVSTCALFLLAAVLVFTLARPAPAAQPQGAGPSTTDVSVTTAVPVQVPGRRLDVSALAVRPVTSGIVQASVAVTVTNTGAASFFLRPDHFALSAEGDIFGQARSPEPTGTLTGTVGLG